MNISATFIRKPIATGLLMVAILLLGLLGYQLLAVLVSFGIAIAGTLICLSIAGLVAGGIRVNEDDEFGGLDLSQHGENAYVFGAGGYAGGGHPVTASFAGERSGTR